MWFYILDPVKEYGCAPWPKVENLIKKCLKENPQERPTSSQVLLRVFISIFVINDTVNLLCFLKRNGKIILVKGMVFFLLLYFSGAEISMEYCLDLLSRINVSIHISQPFIGNLLFFSVWWYWNRMQITLCFLLELFRKDFFVYQWSYLTLFRAHKRRNSGVDVKPTGITHHTALCIGWNFEICLNPSDFLKF